MTIPRQPPLPLEEAQARLIALAPRLPVEHRATAEALGHYLAAPLLAARTQPATALSAMDGYALRAADLPGPWTVIGESAAGHPFAGTVGTGQAVRISTGAALPAGADCVLLQEDCQRSDASLTLTGTPPQPPSRHIRPAGMDFAAHDPLLATGSRLGAAQIALAIAAGHGHVPVYRRLRLAVIDSGDELAAAGHALAPHQIPASNGPMLAAMAAALPVDVQRLGPVPDQLDALAAALDRVRDADIVVTSGGASVGDHDLVRPALEAVGARIDFWRVAIKPGKPLLVGHRAAASLSAPQVILGLPGNPASAYVTAHLFLLPLLRAALGAADPLPRPLAARLAQAMPAGGGRTEFLRGTWNGEAVTLDTLQDSGAIAPIARANCLVRREAGAAMRPEGSKVPIYLLEFGGFA
ncbi:molybdopterin molybdotransferase MoeA [Novosphingobium pokkalii]|uniref:Molybdopterin molybdenumtransferase n=1 Tax=Novosphingobium pokkalii TaxID=1770194 RepID=A0ABV7V0Y7_9SPHN|nr:molybdopterin molybdotransferase MoeA [Novosphingobium pokkalii]GHC87084.1 molybdopterin molybdenumtransferase MoeA [Novosphingobium pokkalii]